MAASPLRLVLVLLCFNALIRRCSTYCFHAKPILFSSHRISPPPVPRVVGVKTMRHTSLPWQKARILPLQASESSDLSSDASSGNETLTADLSESEQEEVVSIAKRIKNWFTFGKDDGLTTRQRLAKMGMSVILSYGFVSNMSYSITMSVAWFAFTKKTGVSPLAPGQWKPFLAVYGGFYIFNNIIRPARIGLSVAVARYFDNAVAWVQGKTNCSRSVSIALIVFLANVCGTLTAMSLGIYLASMASGVAVFPPKA